MSRRHHPRLLSTPASRSAFDRTAVSRGLSPRSPRAFPAARRSRAKGSVTHLRIPLPLAAAAAAAVFAFGLAFGIVWEKASAMQRAYEQTQVQEP